ncbi:Oidioi.mRNA.OKI2018_I69.PAR.g11573.t2.cds [Oikopleura dioica]|uniref:Oidioi.mRNA.OKI2018_I69.PAR.g11573.t2.cds n=1 Tax=Oikopleura dioica TaxID=34765 RepID=A0ABN7RWB4_OIKDI|nr:Oidioi.mRNA.OKI2018_I69.PAR.g11573.t2.cds [Oikopleura dioica]
MDMFRMTQQFVTFPPSAVTTMPIENPPDHSQVYVTVAVHPGPNSHTVVPYGNAQPFVNPVPQHQVVGQYTAQPAVSHAHTPQPEYVLNQAHPISRDRVKTSEFLIRFYKEVEASPQTVKWLMDNFETAEGVSLPRARMYDHYILHSEQTNQEPVNAASFGKLVRSVFVNLKTRRLGTRGNSKYHYYGIKIKENSQLHQIQNDPEFQSKVEKIAPKPAKKTRKAEKVKMLSKSSMKQIESDILTSVIQFGVDDEEIELFEDAYREHCEQILDYVLGLQFDELKQYWHDFWHIQHYEGKHLAKEKFQTLLTIPGVSGWIYQCDQILYKNLVDVLIPDVLKQDVPQTYTSQIRLFAREATSWMRESMETSIQQDIIDAKITAVSHFSSTLRRLTSLTHLIREARPILNNHEIVQQKRADLEKIDIMKIHEQISWVTECPLETVQTIHSGMVSLLDTHASFDDWHAFLVKSIDSCLPERSHPNYSEKAKKFIMSWSYYSSMVIRDLTLRSVQTFGSFHLIRMLLDELVSHVIEQHMQNAESVQYIPRNIIIKTEATSHHQSTGYVPVAAAPPQANSMNTLNPIQYADAPGYST